MQITDSEVASFLENGCSHDVEGSPVADICINCLVRYFRRCKTDIDHEGEHPNCARYFVPARLLDKYCGVCFETVKRGFRE